MLHELNLDLPDENKAALRIIQSVISKITHSEIDTYDGCDFIFSDILDLTDLRKQDKKFVYDNVGLAEVYGLYDSIWELLNTSGNWDAIKRNEPLIEDAKINIRVKLEKWNVM